MSERRTVGLLYPGDMGCAVAAVLRGGSRVVTTACGRSDRSTRRARETGLEVLDGLADVVRQSDVVISLVPPAGAAAVVEDYCELAHLAPPTALYVDANSIGPELAACLSDRVCGCGRGFVDAAVNGLAKNLTVSGTLFLSGPRAGEVAELFGNAVRVRVLGDEPGRASAMKMVLSGVSKGVCALFLELALVARRQGMLAEMLDASAGIYPGIASLVDRMLPTYSRHAGRRAEEMNELAATARAAGVEPCVIDAVRRLHEALAGVAFDAPPGNGWCEWTAASLAEHVAGQGFLAAASTAARVGTAGEGAGGRRE